MGKPSQNEGVSPKYGVTILLAAQHKRINPTLTPASKVWYSIYLPWRDERLSWPRQIDYTPVGSSSSSRRRRHKFLYHIAQHLECWSEVVNTLLWVMKRIQ